MSTDNSATLVLIPGLMCDASLFRGVLPILSRKRAIYIADLTHDDTIEAMARRIDAHTLGPLDVVGFSMGGMVAMELARYAEHRIARLALLDTNEMADTEEVKSWRSGLVVRANRGGFMQVMAEVLVPRYFPPEGPAIPELKYQCLQMAISFGPSIFARQFSALAARRQQTEVLRAFKKPSLVLRGRNDLLCDEATHRRMAAAMPQSRYVEVEGAAHLSILERPDEVGSALVEWLKC